MAAKRKPTDPIVISNWSGGIAASPFVEDDNAFSDMRNIDGQTREGSARLNFQLQPTSFTTYYGLASASGTATFINGNQTISVTADFKITGRQVVTSAQSGGVVSNGATYYVIYINATTIKLATSFANALAGTATTPGGNGSATLTSVDLGLPKYMVYDPNGLIYYMQDSNGSIWFSSSSSLDGWTLLTGNTIDSTANGNGMVLFNNYLLVFRDNNIDTYGPLNSSPAWSNSWKSILGVPLLDHVPYYNPVNGLVYWSEYMGNTGPSITIGSSGLGSLMQQPETIFAPGTGGTYVFISAQTAGNFALQLPTNNLITCMILLGSNLMLGTNQNLIYPWNTYSATYNLPIIVREKNITAMTNDGNVLYFAAGNRGNLYTYNGYYARKIAQVPPYLTNFPFNEPTISNIVKHNNKLFFGLVSIGCSGLWSLNLETGAIVLENLVSDGSYGVLNGIKIGLIFDVGNEQVFVGWYDIDQGFHGLDIAGLNTTNFYYQTGYTAYAETVFYNVGLPRTPRSLENFNFTLGAKLAAGQGIKVYARGNLTDSYPATPNATFDFATYGAVDSIQIPFGKDWVNVQFKIVMTTGATSSTTPQLNSIVIQ